MPPSSLSLLGLVRHLAGVGRGWFDRVAGRDRPLQYQTTKRPDLGFHGAVADPDVVRAAFTDRRRAIDEAREVTASTDLDARFVHRGTHRTLRWLLLHMIEEYARHNGHADLPREAIDGATGE